MTPIDILNAIKLAVEKHKPSEQYRHLQWFVDDMSIDCDASQFWQVVVDALKGMAGKEVNSVNRGGRGGVLIGSTWYFAPTDGRGCPDCGAIGTGGHGGGCTKQDAYDERGIVMLWRRPR